MKILNVIDLSKSYEKFRLDKVSFSLDQGYIMGFIGANGAGKTTTIKSILNLVRTDCGSVEILGKEFKENENHLKQNIGFFVGDNIFYSKRKVKAITGVVKRFYEHWDEDIYQSYLERFKIDPEKKLCELSSGMKVKYSIALALSYNARLMILDEPTSGLDPVARDNLLELFQELVEDGTKSILFSTHITSDLEKCADYITYISNGKIINSSTKDEFIDAYRLVNGSEEQLENIKDDLISYKKNSFGFLGLIKNEKLEAYDDINREKPSLDEIMIYHAKAEEEYEKLTV